jgi:hypothetical protein
MLKARGHRRGLAGAGLFLLAVSFASGGDVIALKAGRIQTVAHGVIDRGVIIIRGDRIVEIGPGVVIPPGTEVLDFPDGFIMPGIVSPDSNLGVSGRPSLGEDEAARFPSVPGKNLADHRVIFSIDPGHPDYALALRNGFTTLAIAPPAAGISGLGVLAAPGPRHLREMVFEKDAFLKISVLVNTPFRRMLKASLEGAGKALKEDGGSDGKAKKAESRDENTEIFVRVASGEIPLIADCTAPNSVAYLLDAIAPYPKIRLAVRGGAEVYKAGNLLKAKSIPVILEPRIGETTSGFNPYPERTNYVLKCRRLELEIAFQAPGAAKEQIGLFDCLNRLRELGLDEETLIKGITVVPARILGIESRVGSLEKGKRADLIVFRRDPLMGAPVIEAVVAGGKVIR